MSHDLEAQAYQRRMRLLAAPMVLGCAFRAIFPNLYLERATWYASPICSILLTRVIVATLAEVCWVAQIASALLFVAGGLEQASPSPGSAANQARGGAGGSLSLSAVARAVATLMVACVCCAELASDFGTVTTNGLGFLIEESLWGVAFAIMLPVAFHLAYRLRRVRWDVAASPGCCNACVFAFLASILGSVYVVWQWTFHVPQEYRMWRQQLEDGAVFYHLWPGVWNALTQRSQTREYEVWGSSLVWLTGYFTFGVWSSIALACAPRLALEPSSPLAGHLGASRLSDAGRREP